MSKSNTNEDRRNKSTSFDLSDEYEKELLKYAELKKHGKFSKYVKRLISEDRVRNGDAVKDKEVAQVVLSVDTDGENGIAGTSINENVEAKTENNSNNNDIKSMSSFL